jgi:S1-C subfamily serine protease
MRRLLFLMPLLGLLLCLTPTSAQAPERPRVSLGLFVEPNAGQAGVIVRDVSPNSPADKAGVKKGDVILKAGDKDIATFESLVGVLDQHQPGDKLPVRVRRDGKEQNLTVTLAQRSAPPRAERIPLAPPKPVAFLGVHALQVTPAAKEKGVTVDQGAVVADVMHNSPAEKAGLKPGDVIVAVDGKAIADPVQLREAIHQAGVGKKVTLKIARGKETKELTAELEESRADVFSFPHLPAPFRGNPTVTIPRALEELQRSLPDADTFQQLEQRIKDLEKRVRELEQKSK